MIARGLKLVAAVCVLGVMFSLGILAGLDRADEPAPQPIALAPAPSERGPGEPSETLPACPSMLDLRDLRAELAGARKRIEELESRLALAGVLERGYQGQLFGTPQPWPADTPAHLAPQGFQDLLARSMDACEVPAELVGFDCEEAPCIAMLRPAGRGWIWSLIRDCPEWAERFRRVPLRTDFWADCGPGETEHVVLLSPFWADFPGDRENLDKRLGARFSQIRERWRCGRAR